MGSVLTAFDEGVASSTDLDRKVDAAIIATGRELANQIDYAVENLSGTDLTKALYLTPHLVNILKEMRATPASRVAVEKPKNEKPRGKLASVSEIPRPKSS
jgi:hypothetical protein